MIAIVFQHGRFLAFDTHQTAVALTCYAGGLAAYAALKLVAPAFYALGGDARTPALVSLASVAVNAATALTLVRIFGFGHYGLALSTSVVSTFSAVVLLLLIRGKIGGIKGETGTGGGWRAGRHCGGVHGSGLLGDCAGVPRAVTGVCRPHGRRGAGDSGRSGFLLHRGDGATDPGTGQRHRIGDRPAEAFVREKAGLLNFDRHAP